MSGKQWTNEETEQLRTLRRMGKSIVQCSLIMSRPAETIARRAKWLRHQTTAVKHCAFVQGGLAQPNPQAIEDMHRRNALEYPTITAALMGDPIIGSGRSALEKMSRS